MEKLRHNIKTAAEGDIVLVVGPQKVRIHAYSLFLKATSKPFSAMFGPGWKEGHAMLGQEEPVEILLPEDNAAALELICAIIHHRNDKVHQSLAASNVLAVAVTADKYDFSDALKLASAYWLRPGQNKAGDLMLLSAAAFLFNNAQAFKDITRALILDYDGSYLALSCKGIESAITRSIFCEYLLHDEFGQL
jgi:hypothetical protein